MLKIQMGVRASLTAMTALLAALAVADAGAVRQDPRPTFRSGVARVAVTAVAETRDGRPVTDLRPEEFQLVDGGEARAISDVRMDETPVRLALLVDASGSMSVAARRDAARAVATHVLAWLEPGHDQAGLFTFDSSLLEVAPIAPVSVGLLDEFDTMLPYGKTSLFDAIAETGRRLAVVGGSRRAVVTLTDGVDNASRLSAGEVSGLASAIDVPVYVVLVVSPLDQTGSADAVQERLTADLEGQLGDLARWTGGAIFAATGPARASVAARQIVHELRHQYLISFEPDERPGWHPIELRTTRKDVVVRTRSGYVVQARPVVE
jgi:Ca-activated chloride channel family protein